MNIEITTKSPKETQAVARALAEEILCSKLSFEHSFEQALVIALRGDLGGGKTTFTQGFAKGLSIKRSVLSPTFVLMQSYKIQNTKYKRLVHIDAYRLEKPKELAILGWKDLVSDNTNIILVEWAERLGKLLPKERIDIQFEFIDDKTRIIKIRSTKFEIRNKSKKFKNLEI